MNLNNEAELEKTFSNESWFKAGKIIQYIMDNRDKRVLQYGISFNENAFEICSIVKQRLKLDREIKLVPLNYGFSMYITMIPSSNNTLRKALKSIE